jgi:hypothetical protein
VAALEIPLSQTLTDYTERIDLDGVVYEFRFRWNPRAEAWFVDISDADGEPLVFGRKVTVDTLLTQQHKHVDGIAQGQLTAFDTTNRRIDPEQEDFGTRVLLLYFDITETFEAE